MIPERRLAGPPVTLSELSLGGAQLGNLYREVSDAEAHATVETAWELGIRYFDTAPHYGLGLSERRLGAALTGRPRDAYVLSSKVGRLLEPVERADSLDEEGFAVPATYRRVWDFSRDGIRRSIAESLERLGLDRLDIVYLHDPDDHIGRSARDRLSGTEELRSEGVVGAIGAGMNNAPPLADLVRRTDVDVVMLAGRYTLSSKTASTTCFPSAGGAASASSPPVCSTADCWRALARPQTPGSTTRRRRGARSTGARDRRDLRTARDFAAGRCTGLSARAPRRRQASASAPGTAKQVQETRPRAGEAILSRPVERPQGHGAPSHPTRRCRTT